MSKIFSVISDAIEKLCQLLGVVTVAGFVILITAQVVCRNILKIPMVWANDIAVVLFVWATFFGSAIAVRKRSHYVLAFLSEERFKKINCFLDIVSDISGIIFFYVLIRYGYAYTIMGLKRLSTSINIPQAYFFAAIPVSGCFMMYYTLLHAYGDVKRLAGLLHGGQEESK